MKTNKNLRKKSIPNTTQHWTKIFKTFFEENPGFFRNFRENTKKIEKVNFATLISSVKNRKIPPEFWLAFQDGKCAKTQIEDGSEGRMACQSE